MSNVAYYARPMSIYGSPQVKRDENLIRSLGYEPIDIDTLAIQEEAIIYGMVTFMPLVASADVFFFRAFPDGSLGAGVVQEIEWARERNIPVLELPSCIERRTLTVEQTRATLRESGQR